MELSGISIKENLSYQNNKLILLLTLAYLVNLCMYSRQQGAAVASGSTAHYKA